MKALTENEIKENTMYDICYGCGKVFEYGTLPAINEVDFDIYCPDCLKEIRRRNAQSN